MLLLVVYIWTGHKISNLQGPFQCIKIIILVTTYITKITNIQKIVYINRKTRKTIK